MLRNLSLALVTAVCASGLAQAQTTTLIDTELNVPSYLSSTSSFDVTDGGSLFVVGTTSFDAALQGVGILEKDGAIVDTFALTNGSLGEQVFNKIELASAGAYTFLYDFANSNSTVGGTVGITATVSAMTAPEIDPSSAMAGLTLLCGGLAALRGRKTTPNDASAS